LDDGIDQYLRPIDLFQRFWPNASNVQDSTPGEEISDRKGNAQTANQ
jgi:hypothetical protein